MNNYALLIGITYRHSPSSFLPGPENDVIDMQNMLKTKGYTNFDILCDAPEKFNVPTKQPTADNIRHALIRLIKYSREHHKSKIILYYSGHGTSVNDNNRDEKDGRDEVIIASDGVGIRDDHIRNMVSYVCPCSDMLCIMDSCNSGTIMDLQYKYNSVKKNYDICNKFKITPNILAISVDLINPIDRLSPENWDSSRACFSVIFVML